MTKNENNDSQNCNKTVALYERVSRKESLGDESYGIQSQKILLEQADLQEGYTKFLHYTDDGCTGTDMNRPMLKAMCTDIENGKVSAVFVQDISRIGRDYLEVGAMLTDYFPKHGVRFISASEGIDSEKEEFSMSN
ncbi:MAG: recombinase family protein [Oscillospiraceae bacterium]